MAVIASLSIEELDEMCQEMIDCLDNNTFSEEKFVEVLSNWDLQIITAANVPENYMEEGHMRDHWLNLSNFLTTLQQKIIKESKIESEDHQHEKESTKCLTDIISTTVQDSKITSSTTSNDRSALVDAGTVNITLSSHMRPPSKKRSLLHNLIQNMVPNISQHLTKKQY